MALVLLLGPDKDRAGGVRALLREDGHRVVWRREIAAWTGSERELGPELVVADVPSLEPVLALDAPRGGFPAPLLWVDHEGHLAATPQHEPRLVDRISTPFLREELTARVDALVLARRVVVRRGDVVEQEDGSTPGFAGRVVAFFRKRSAPPARPLAPYLEVSARLAEWADLRHGFAPGHADRVASCCATIADKLELSDEDVTVLLRAARLHDIGKVGLPLQVLRQQAPLEEHQRRLIRTHARRGAALVRALDQDEAVADAVLYHHERPDGGGYHARPAADTPIAARILAVAEVWDGLTHSQHGPQLSRDEALERLEQLRGESVDAECGEILVRSLRRTGDIPDSRHAVRPRLRC